MDAQEVMHMTDYSKITALYSRLSVGDEEATTLLRLALTSEPARKYLKKRAEGATS